MTPSPIDRKRDSESMFVIKKIIVRVRTFVLRELEAVFWIRGVFRK